MDATPNSNLVKKYQPLAIAAGLGSVLGSGIIVGMSATITVWQTGLGLSNTQVGVISGSLTFAIAFGSLFAGWITKAFGLVRTFNWMDFLYAIGALICVFAPNYLTLLLGGIVTGFASGVDLPVSLTTLSTTPPTTKPPLSWSPPPRSSGKSASSLPTGPPSSFPRWPAPPGPGSSSPVWPPWR